MIYLLYGEEQLLIDKKLASILEKNKNAGVEKFDAPEPKILIETISIPSLFAPVRVLIITNLDLSGDVENLMDSFANLPPGISLIIKNPIGLDKRSKIYKTIESYGEVHEFKAIPQWEEESIIDFVIKTFADNKKKISRDGAYLLVEGVGRNLALISSEIEKICTYLGQKEEVEPKDLETIIVKSGWDAFSFAENVLNRNSSQAASLLQRLLRDKEDPIGLLGLLSSQFRTLYKIKLLSAKSPDPGQITRRLKASPFYIKKLLDKAKKFTLGELKRAIEIMYNADLAIKSGQKPENILALLVADLA